MTVLSQMRAETVRDVRRFLADVEHRPGEGTSAHHARLVAAADGDDNPYPHLFGRCLAMLESLTCDVCEVCGSWSAPLVEAGPYVGVCWRCAGDDAEEGDQG